MLAIVERGQRLAQYPDVPTFKESGYDIEGSAWYGAVRAGRHAADDRRQARAEAAIDAAPDPTAQKLEPLGLDVTAKPRAAPSMAKISARLRKWGPVIRASGFKAD